MVVVLMMAELVFVMVVALMMVELVFVMVVVLMMVCLLYTSPSPRDVPRSRMPSSA